jgi:hypothetical protein
MHVENSSGQFAAIYCEGEVDYFPYVAYLLPTDQIATMLSLAGNA